MQRLAPRDFLRPGGSSTTASANPRRWANVTIAHCFGANTTGMKGTAYFKSLIESRSRRRHRQQVPEFQFLGRIESGSMFRTRRPCAVSRTRPTASSWCRGWCLARVVIRKAKIRAAQFGAREPTEVLPRISELLRHCRWLGHRSRTPSFCGIEDAKFAGIWRRRVNRFVGLMTEWMKGKNRSPEENGAVRGGETRRGTICGSGALPRRCSAAQAEVGGDTTRDGKKFSARATATDIEVNTGLSVERA